MAASPRARTPTPRARRADVRLDGRRDPRSDRRRVADDVAPLFAAAYGVTDAGNWEGRTILRASRTTRRSRERFGLQPAEVARRLAAARDVLLARRATRPQPARDDKVLAAWNGLAIAALADAGRPLAATDPLTSAARDREPPTRRRRLLTARTGRPAPPLVEGRPGAATGVLEDHAHLADGLLALYEATFDERWFVAARELADLILDHFADPAGGFFDTADDHERSSRGPRTSQDNASRRAARWRRPCCCASPR